VRRQLSGWGTVAVTLGGLMAAPLAGSLLAPLILITALVVGAGAEAHARFHPRFSAVGSPYVGSFWIGPALAVLAAALAATRLEVNLARGVSPLAAALVGVLLFAQDRELDSREERWTPLAFALILYLAAFVLFALTYGPRDSVALSVLGCGASSMLLSAALFRPTRAPPRRVWLFAALIGLCVGQLALALSTWVASGLVGGAFLLLYFYVAAGLVNALLDRSLDTRLAIEYGLVALLGLVFIVLSNPLRP
jgi:uncharacterized protein DUF5656